MDKHKQVSIKLTDEQKRLIKDGTGHNVHELSVSIEGGNAVGRPGSQSEMEEGGRVEQRERNNISYPARSGR
jgi:hypothetical protein